MKERLAFHTMNWLGEKAIISTVKIFGTWETMVMFEDGDEIECFESDSEELARKTHNEVMRKWNDKLYEGSTAKLLGAPNIGQFVHCIKAC